MDFPVDHIEYDATNHQGKGEYLHVEEGLLIHQFVDWRKHKVWVRFAHCQRGNRGVSTLVSGDVSVHVVA